ncbi:lipase [Intrasporangium oryzae NRRL B-24470]|uniref:Lipase n=2 Tax=Intrasporangium TaxID=53357 RepID=W9GAF8_9MICO|nr:lipase [Intrasporangium oryzae NRRL B-24470]
MPLRTRVFVKALARERPAIRTLGPDDLTRVRAWVAPARPPYTWVTGPVHRDVAIESSGFAARDGHHVPVRIYRPRRAAASPRPALMWFHGGGWVLGSPRGYDPICSAIAHDTGVVVVSVDYRLAPEHRAPKAALDCVDATRWVAREAVSLGVRPTGIGVAGDSAGGNLAAVVSQVLRDEGGAEISYQCLVYPGVDATMSSPSVTEHAEAPVLTHSDMVAFLEHYLGEGPDALDPLHPLVSPLYAAELGGLPPALVQTADLDPLRDEGAMYARALRAAGVEVVHTNYLRAPHGFLSFPGATPAGRAARRDLTHWVRARTWPGTVD